MPWTSEYGNTYKLCMLDTNALSEILKRPSVEGRGFIENLSPETYAPCFTIYNIIEMRRREDVYKKFLDFFSVYSCFLLKPFQILHNDEFDSYDSKESVSALFNAFSYFGRNKSYDIKYFIEELFSSKEIMETEKNWRKREQETLDFWLSNKKNFTPTKNYPNTRDAEKYIEEAGIQTLINLNPQWVKTQIDKGHIPNLDKFPSIKVMLYSMYYRLYDPSWSPNPQEVTDVNIVAASPYVDVFITEKFQANIFNKIKNKVIGLEDLEVLRLRDIR